MTERVTLITGASAGIGTELARVFASNGHRVALVARRADRLATLADEIVAGGGAAPIVIACDLEQPDAGDKIAAALAAEGVEVEFVVNNAGFGLFGNAIDLDRAEQLGIIAVNIRALTDLSLRFSDQPDPASRRHPQCRLRSPAFCRDPGWRSIMRPRPMCCRSPRRCAAELAPRGVRVTALCPGPVPSEFQARAGFKPGFDSAILNVTPADVAKAGYRGLMANKRAVLPGLGIKIVPLLLRLFPRGFILWAVGRFQLGRRR